MRIATWNINGLRARLDYVGHFLRDVSPDVIGFQELKMEDTKFPHEAFEEMGYRALTHGQKSWNGVAILTKEEASLVQTGLPGQEEMGARLIAADVGGIRFATVYCPNGKTLEHEDFQRKLAWFDDLRGWLDTQDASAPLVLCGDFNIVPEPLDSWSEEKLGGGIFHTAAERARFQALRDWGFSDLFRHLRPEEAGHSWWDYRAGAFHKRMGLRIDMLLATAPVTERAESAHLLRDWRKKVEGLTPSDHAPVWVDLRD
ncbi:MAG: exodeoxyribonuclease III [Sandaracinaceae bacterium]